MSRKEIDRYDVIRRVIRKEITGVHAAHLLHLCERQIRRMKRRVKVYGPSGLIHKNRGKPSNNGISESERAKIVALLKKKYTGFKPTFAAEKLFENHKIERDPKTVRGIMIAEKLWMPATGRKREYRREWRKRKDAYGEMSQFDGSYHDWFEGRSDTHEQCLLAAIDDATGGIVQAKFAEHEGVLPVMDFWKEYICVNGKPRIIYLDKFSTYKINHKVASENPDVKTQFQRACNQLGIEPIFANSPQAKGRVERLFKTLQDRLVKELRLAGISTVAEANAFLETYLPKFNARFAVEPASNINLHKSLTADEKKNLDSILSRHTERTVQNDFTFSFKNQWHQILETPSIAVRKKDVVTVEEHTDGTLRIRLRGKELNYELLPIRPKQQSSVPWTLTPALKERIPARPSPDHQWRLRMAAEVERCNLVKTKQRIPIHL